MVPWFTGFTTLSIIKQSAITLQNILTLPIIIMVLHVFLPALMCLPSSDSGCYFIVCFIISWNWHLLYINLICISYKKICRANPVSSKLIYFCPLSLGNYALADRYYYYCCHSYRNEKVIAIVVAGIAFVTCLCNHDCLYKILIALHVYYIK